MTMLRRIEQFFRRDDVSSGSALPLRPTRSGSAFERLEERLLLSAQPVVSLQAGDALIGGQAHVAVTFTNQPDGAAGSNVGYAPYVDLIIPHNGADGAGVGNAPVNDGATFVSATLLGTAVSSTVVEFDASGHAVHPFAKDASGNLRVVNASDYGAAAGDQLVVLQLPFGSFVASQPAATVDVTLDISNLADLNTPLPVSAVGGFAYGRDAQDNPTTDAPVLGATATGAITPTLATLTKVYNGPEGETATGPNFPRSWTINFDVAPGQQLTNATLTDLLPDGIVVIGTPTVSGAAGTATYDPVTNHVTVAFTGPITGAAGVDASVTINFYIAENLAPGTPGTPVLDPVTGGSRTLENNVTGQADWVPIDTRDTTQTFVIDEPGPEATVIARSIATQKTQSVVVDQNAAGLGPGDTVEYVLNVQVSDYFDFRNVVLTDLASDGQVYLDGSARIEVSEGGSTTGSGAFTSPNILISRDPATGVTTFTFDVSDQLAANGADTDLIGGDNGLGATTFRIVYRTTVESTFAATGLPVGQGDTISNTASVTGDVLDSGGTTTGGAPTDGTSSSATVDTGAITKTIYAINGVVVGPGPIEVGAGDLVTFRLTYDLPQTQTAGLQLVDYVPLPIFSVDGVTLTLLDVVSADAPGLNQAKWGPLAGGFDAAQTMAPTVTIDAASNSLTFLFTNLDPTVHSATTADILFTLKVVDGAFGDKLLLTNTAQGTELSSGNTSTSTEAIAQLTYNEPELHITKGIVATDDAAGDFSPGAVGPVPFTAPGSAGVRFTGDIDSTGLAATPIDSNLSDVDAGDRVTFALVVENTGSGANGAFDILVLDNLPQGYVIPASGLNLSVTNGAGTALAFTGDLFNGGIRITDPGATTGALSAYAATGGTNVLVITYDLQLTSDVQSRSLITNQAAIANYAAIEGGVDHVPASTGPVQDTATTQVGDPTVDKTVTATSVAETGTAMGDPALQDLTVGETITFDITATLREGRIQDFVLQDVLPTVPGQLDYVSAALVSIGSSLFLRNADGSQGAALGTPTIEVNGHTIRFVFANDILNFADNVVTDGDKVVVRVTAVVANVAGNQPGTELGNVGSLIYETAAAQTVTLTDTATAEVVGPSFRVDKTADVETVQGGDIVTYTVDITPVASDFGAPLFDIDLQDVLNQGSLTLVPGSIVIVTGPAGMTTSENDLGGGYMVPAAHIPTLMPGESVRITYQVVVSPTVVAGTTIPNLVSGQGDTIPGVSPTGVERIIAGSAQDTVHVPGPGLIKTVVSTSLPETGSGAYDTTRPDLAIGEEVTYQIIVTFPEAVSGDVDVTDLLPIAAALGGNSDGVFEYVSSAFVSQGANLSFDGPGTFTVDDRDGDGVNDRVVLHLGNVTNAVDGVSDANDQMVFTVTARVRNAPINHAGEAPVNIAQVDFGTGVTEARAAVDIVEPVVSGGKTASVTHGDAGDTVSYQLQVVLSDPNAGPAFDMVVTDNVPVGMDIVVSSLAFSGFTPVGATLSYDSATRTITATIPTYLISDPKIVIVYDAVVANTVHPGEVLTNTAQLSFDSYPGDPGPDYQRLYGPLTDSAAFTVDLPELSKSVTSTDIVSTGTEQLDPNVTDVAIGETVTYLVTLRLPEGQTSLVLTDFAPSAMGAPPIAGDMEILQGVVVSIGANITGSSLRVGSLATLTDGNGDGILSQASWNFGNLTNVADNVESGADLIVVAIRARVLNNVNNEAGDHLVNSVQAQYTLADGSTDIVAASAPVEIVAPKLDIVKDAAIGTGTTGDAGDVVDYTVTISHDALSSATAYGLVLTDALGPGLQLVTGSVTVSLAGATIVHGNGGGDTDVEIRLGELDFPGTPQSLVIHYKAKLTDSVREGDTLPNTATIDYQSAPTGFVQARPDTASDDASVSVVFPVALDKTVVATSLPETGSGYFDATLPDLAAGETVTYEIRVTLGEGTQTVLVGDTLPAGLDFVSGEVVSIGAGISNTSLNVGDAPTVTGSNISFDFGNNVLNTGDNVLDAGDVIVLRVVARMATGVAAGTVLTNAATFTHDTGTLTDNAPVEAVAPVVTITKTPSVATGDAGDTVTFTVVIAEGAGGSAPLYDLSAQDILPAGYELVAGSATASRGTVSEIAGGTIRLDLSGLALSPTDDPATVGVDESRITLTYQVRLADSVQPGQVITNTVAYTGESAPGAAAGTAQEYTGQADAVVTILMPVQLDKTIVATSLPESGTAQFDPTLTDLSVGETVTYRIVATLSEGTQTLVISDTLPPGLEILSSSVTDVGAGLPSSLGSVVNTGTGQGILFNFGTVVNTGNNDTADGTVTIEVVARVRDIAGNQAGTTLTNAASVTIASTTAPGAPDGTETATDQITAEVVAPELVLDKQAPPQFVQPGETIAYTVTLVHDASSTAAAYDIVLTDLLADPNLELVVGTVTTDVGTVTLGNNAGDTTLRIDVPVLALGQSIHIAFTARVRADAPGAITLTNTVDADFDSAAGEGGRPDHLTDGTEVPMAPVLTKEIVATGNPDTGTSQFDPTVPDLAVGETLTYRLTITLPQGTTQNLNLADLLPPSLTPLSAQVISIGGGLTAGAPVITISGQTVSIAFGDVVNGSAAAVDANDRIVIEVNAVVADVAGVVAGAQLVNAADTTFTIGGRDGELTAAAPAELVEPELAITKQVDHTTGDAGDVFTYTVTIQHAAGSTSAAYDLSLQDVLDPVLVPIDVTSSAGTASIVGGTVEFSMVRLATGDAPVVLTYRVRFADAVEPGQVVGNTASLGWDSNPGAGGRPDSGQASAANLTAVFSLDLTKTIIATSLPDTGTAQFNPALTDLAVGETVTYRLVATVAEGTQHLVISDALPAGLGLISAVVTDVGAGLPPGLSVTTNTGSGQDILFDFGTVVNTGNNITTDGTVTIEIVARVLNVPGNVAGHVLTNAANALVEAPTDPTAPGGTLTDDAAALAEVVTPDGGGGGRDPVITKSSTLPSGDAGDEVTFTVVVQQPGSSTAPVYDLSVADAIPAGMTLIAGSVTTTRGIVASGNGSGDTTLRIEVAGLALAAADDPGTPGIDESSITITYRARLTDAVQPGERVTNIAAFLAYSAPVADSGGEARPFDGLASTTTDVLMPVQIEKSIVATSLGESGTSHFNPLQTDLSVGETVTYRIVATLSEGTQTLVISDTLPDGLEILSSSVTGVGAGLPSGLSAVGNTGTGQGILFNFGTVVNTGNNILTDGTVTIEIVARVRDIASNVAGATLTNTATVVVASPTAPGVPNGTETATDQVTAEVVTPDLAIVKQVDHHNGNAGDVFTYTVTVANQPDATGAAYDIVIDDPLSPYLLAVPGSVTSSVGTATIIGNRIHVEIPVLIAGAAPVVITYRAAFADTVQPGQLVPNVATLDYASAPTFGHAYEDADLAVVRVGFTLDLTKTVVDTSLPETGSGYFNPTLADLAAGETVTYQLVATISEGTQHLVVTDTMPTGLVAESARLVSAGTGIAMGVPVITVTNGLVTFDFGTIVNAGDNLAGDRIVLEVIARRTAEPAAGSVLTNTAQAIDTSLTSQGLPGAVLTAQATAQVEAVAAVLVFEKEAQPATVGLGEPINYTVNLGHASNSTAPAYDVVLTDPLSDPSLQLIAGTVVTSMGTVVSGNAPGDTTIVIRVAVLLPGQVLHVTFQGRAVGIPVPDGIVPNTASFASNSTPGDQPARLQPPRHRR
jgi:fimbrial isopeptide formation D2 family protein/uncharacterized repeat protein (TIGR01451 family)